MTKTRLSCFLYRKVILIWRWYQTALTNAISRLYLRFCRESSTRIAYGQDRLGGDEPCQSIPPDGIAIARRTGKSVAGVGYRIGESDDDEMATGRDGGLGQPVFVHVHQARHSGWDRILGHLGPRTWNPLR